MRIRRSTEISYRFGARRFFETAFVFFVVSTGFAFAQTTSPTTNDSGGGTVFVPSLDVDSPNVFSSVDAARRNRPPKPSKVKEDLFYPEGFLTLSEETPEPSSLETVPKKSGAVERPLNPGVETTPIGPPSEPEPPKKSRGDQILFFATSIALAALGVFVYFDYRYRDRLKTELARNARLCSPSAVAADFEETLAKDGGLFSDGSYVDPELETPSFFLNGSGVVDSFQTANFDRFSDETSENGYNAVSADLKEENFDFVPEASVAGVPEPQEDFVVGQSDATK